MGARLDRRDGERLFVINAARNAADVTTFRVRCVPRSGAPRIFLQTHEDSQSPVIALGLSRGFPRSKPEVDGTFATGYRNEREASEDT